MQASRNIEERALLDLHIQLADVFADNGHAEHTQTAQEAQGTMGRGAAAGGDASECISNVFGLQSRFIVLDMR